MPHGITNTMNNIRGPLSARSILRKGIRSRIITGHEGLSNRATRRRDGIGVKDSINTPYVNPARDLRPGKHRRGRHLRAELRAA